MISSCKEKDLFICPVLKDTPDKNIRRCIDDTLIWANSIWTSYHQIWYILDFCSKEGIIFNPKKMKLGETSLNIFGYHLDQSGQRPTNKFMDALLKYPNPKNIKEMRGFFGIIAQCQWAVLDTARNEIGKLHEKLQTKHTRKWTFTADDEVTFKKVKELVCKSVKNGIN
jgi:hypothetical protein